MIRFRLFGFPIQIEPFFWLTCVLIGGGATANSRMDWFRVLLWTIVVLISILFHEFGHAFVARRFGASPYIILQAFGGWTVWKKETFTRAQKIMITAAGPLAGFSLGLLAWLTPLPVFQEYPFLSWAFQSTVRIAVWVNIVWTVLNLLPVLPLDGGQILRELLGPTKQHITRNISIFVAIVMGGLAFFLQLWVAGILFLYLGYSNYKNRPIQTI